MNFKPTRFMALAVVLAGGTVLAAINQISADQIMTLYLPAIGYAIAMSTNGKK